MFECSQPVLTVVGRFPDMTKHRDLWILLTIASAMVMYVRTLPWIPACFWKQKFVKKSTPLSRNPNSAMEQIRIFLAWRNQTPHIGVLPVLPSICVYFKNVPKSKKCVIVAAIENAKLKLIKGLSSYNNALCDSYKLFLQQLTPQLTLETWGLWIFSAKCDVILKFRRISFNMSQGFMRMPCYLDLDLIIGIHTCTAKLSACWGGGGGARWTLPLFSVCTIRVLLESAYFFSFCFQRITYSKLSTYK